MTVKELKAELAQCSDDDLVVISRDAEGNGFSPLYEASENMYEADGSSLGEIYERELTDEMRSEGYTEEDVRAEGDGVVNCIVLWPTN